MNNKYLLWIAILVVFCCGLVSCNLNNNHGNIEETSKTESMISDETTNLQNDENNMNDEVEEPSTSLESYEVYCNYILNNKSCLPEGFVTYEMLSSIGEFKSLVFPNDYDMEYYQYQIIGDDGFPIAVYVDHRNSENSSPNISTKQPVYLDKFPSDNMTYSERYKSETVVYNDILSFFPRAEAAFAKEAERKVQYCERKRKRSLLYAKDLHWRSGIDGRDYDERPSEVRHGRAESPRGDRAGGV